MLRVMRGNGGSGGGGGGVAVEVAGAGEGAVGGAGALGGTAGAAASPEARGGGGGLRPMEREPRWVHAGARDHAHLVSKEAIHVMPQRQSVAAQHPRGME